MLVPAGTVRNPPSSQMGTEVGPNLASDAPAREPAVVRHVPAKLGLSSPRISVPPPTPPSAVSAAVPTVTVPVPLYVPFQVTRLPVLIMIVPPLTDATTVWAD